jgi:peptide deformylase
MAILPIYVAPHPVLKKKAVIVDRVTDDLRQLMEDMLDTMYASEGIGLAAPQVGISQRILVLDIDQPKEVIKDAPSRGKPQYFVNPEIIWSSEEIRIYNEGCLSLPELYAEVTRPEKIKLRYLDFHGQAQELEAEGLLATCLQHELDHLNGVLFVDHLSNLKRDMILRKLKKWAKDHDDAEDETYIF